MIPVYPAEYPSCAHQSGVEAKTGKTVGLVHSCASAGRDAGEGQGHKNPKGLFIYSTRC